MSSLSEWCKLKVEYHNRKRANGYIINQIKFLKDYVPYIFIIIITNTLILFRQDNIDLFITVLFCLRPVGTYLIFRRKFLKRFASKIIITCVQKKLGTQEINAMLCTQGKHRSRKRRALLTTSKTQFTPQR